MNIKARTLARLRDPVRGHKAMREALAQYHQYMRGERLQNPFVIANPIVAYAPYIPLQQTPLPVRVAKKKEGSVAQVGQQGFTGLDRAV